MRMPREHLPGDVARNLHDGLIASAVLRRFGNERVPVIVPAPGTPAFLRTLFQAVFSDPICLVGSFGKRLPPGNTNHSGLDIANLLWRSGGMIHKRKLDDRVLQLLPSQFLGPVRKYSRRTAVIARIPDWNRGIVGLKIRCVVYARGRPRFLSPQKEEKSRYYLGRGEARMVCVSRRQSLSEGPDEADRIAEDGLE